MMDDGKYEIEGALVSKPKHKRPADNAADAPNNRSKGNAKAVRKI